MHSHQFLDKQFTGIGNPNLRNFALRAGTTRINITKNKFD
jgi:hypothetical protein